MRHNFFWDWVYSCGPFLFNFVMCFIVGLLKFFFFCFKIKLVVRHWDRFEVGCQLSWTSSSCLDVGHYSICVQGRT